MRNWIIACAGIGCLSLLVGCGDGESSSGTGGTAGAGGATGGNGTTSGGAGGGGGAGAEIDQFCGAVVDPFCDALFGCCTDAGALVDYGADATECKTKFAGLCAKSLEDALSAGFAAGITSLDSARLSACVTRLKGPAKSCEEPAFDALEVCLGAFRGNVAPGESCGVLHQDVSFAECDGGLCEPDSKCVAFLADGAACDPANDPAAFCDMTAGQWCSGVSMKCGPRGAAGDPCSLDGESVQCLSRNCDGAQCQPPTAAGLCP